MASFQKYKTKHGEKWLFKIYTDKIDPVTGRKKSTTRRGFNSKREAETAARYLENDIDLGLDLSNKSITFSKFSKRWLELYKEENGVKPGTIRVRKHELNNLYKYFENVMISDITWQSYQKALLDLNLKFSINTLSGIHGTARMIFKKALQLEVIKKDPTEFAYIPKKVQSVEDLENETSLPKYMEKEQLGHFLKVCHKFGLQDDFEIFLTLAYTGIRVGELCALKETDLLRGTEDMLNISKTYYNPKNITTSYQLVTPKTKSSRRKINIDLIVVKSLENVIERNHQVKREFGNEYHDEGFIFTNDLLYPGYPIYIKKIQYRMKRLLKLAKLNERLTPHSLRHTHTSLQAEAGVSIERIMERLGHSSDEITKQVYLHTTDAVRKRDSEMFGNLMKNVLNFDV